MQIDRIEEFVPGKTRIKYGGAYTDQDDFDAINSVLDRNWWTIDPHGHAGMLEKELAEKVEMDYAVIANSGSSALFIMYAALRAMGAPEGAEVITGAVQFPTAITGLYYNRFEPVFVDVDPKTSCIDVSKIEDAITDKTYAILAVNIAGNMPDIDHLQYIAEKHGLKLLLDNCDGFGGKWDGDYVENYFDMSATSFHAAHIMAMGEGGAVFTNSPEEYKVLSALREWGRAGDTDKNTSYPEIPSDYPGRYIFEYMGMNLKPLELQCAMGRTQLKKLDEIKNLRQTNFNILYTRLGDVEEIILPHVHNLSEPSWFSFPMLVEERGKLRDFLEERNIETRTVFGGNITRQPAFKNIGRISGQLTNADLVMEKGMFVSVHPSSTPEMMEYVAESIKEFYYLNKAV